MRAIPQCGIKFVKAQTPCAAVNKIFGRAVTALYGIFRSFVVFFCVVSGVKDGRLCNPPASVPAFRKVRCFNFACPVMLKILQELAGVAEASRVLTVEFGEMWNGEFWRVEESWMEWKEFVECVFGLARVEYRFGKNTKGE